MRFWFSCFLFLLFEFLASGQARIYTAVRLEKEKIRLDGKIDEAAWELASWGDGFKQLKPYENQSPSQSTSFKILYDDNNIYVAIKAFDKRPDSVSRRMSRRDEADGDLAGIAFDSYHDQRTAFVFIVSAAGVKSDAVVSNNGGNWDYSWDPIWYVQVSLDSSGWAVEMRIPLNQLRFGKQDNYTWGLQVGRNIFRTGEETGWQFISSNAPGWVSFFGKLEGIKGIQPQKQSEIVPYVVSDIERYKKSNENPFETGKGSKLSAGLDGKFGITNDLTLDVTVNPDFGQVEADPSVVNLSTYETYLQEKRPFFIEGRNIMNFNFVSGGPLSSDNLFYSRRIGRSPQLNPGTDDREYVKRSPYTTILGAGKLTGRTKSGWSVGILEAVTQRENLEIDSMGIRRSEPAEPITNYLVSRVIKDFNNGNTYIGGMFTATNRRLDDPILSKKLRRNAYTGGFDYNHQWKNKTYYINAKTVFSYVDGTKEAILETQRSGPRYFQRPDAPHLKVDSSLTKLTGFGGTLTGGRAGNSKWPFLLWLTWRSPSLEMNDLGYLYNPDIIQQIIWVGYQNYEPFGIFRNFIMNFNQWYGSTFGPEKLYFGGNAEANADFINYWHAGLGISYDTKSLSTSELRGGSSLLFDPTVSYYGNISTDSRKKFVFSIAANHNIGMNNAFNVLYLNSTITWRVSTALKISLSPNIMFNRSNLAYVINVDTLPEITYIRGSLNQTETSLTIRLNYNITPDFTIQYYGMPFVSAGSYSHYKHILNPVAGRYSERFREFELEQITQSKNGVKTRFNISENSDGNINFYFDSPDFNRFEFRSNLIARWEYSPGSVLYVVWSLSQNRNADYGKYSFFDDMGEIFKTHPYNVFLVKLSYRFSL